MYGPAVVDFLLPPAIDGKPLVALPAGTPVEEYASAWFPEAAWEHRPGRAAGAAGDPPLTGARFRGMSSAPPAQTGVLRLSGGTVLEGPFVLDPAAAQSLGVPPRAVDVYAVQAQDRVEDPLTAAWLEAVALRTGGAATQGRGAPWRVPDHGSLVDLTLWTDAVVPPQELLPLLRPSLAGTRLGPVQPEPERGEHAFSVAAVSDYDGALVLMGGRSDEVPAVLAQLRWGPDGPWSYAVSWAPEDLYQLEQPTPSRLHVIARSRMATSIARAMGTLWRVAGGTVVDAAGFVVTPDELAERSSTLRG